ncbi:MAG: DUF6338 family protein [Pirellulales bacterium]
MDLSNEAITFINTLLPGFLAAWVFHGLTAHPKRGWFDRTVQALIFTTIVQAAVGGIRGFSLWLGRQFEPIGPWTNSVGLAWALSVGVVLGLLFAGFANNNSFHCWLSERRWYLVLRKKPGEGGWTWTKRTAYPSEWYSCFHRDARWVVLHLRDGRRLYGWPLEYPDMPNRGHFILTQAEWLLSSNERVPLHTVERMLVPAHLVRLVEFEKSEVEVEVQPAEVERCAQILTDLQKGTDDGKQVLASATEASADKLCQGGPGIAAVSLTDGPAGHTAAAPAASPQTEWVKRGGIGP